jgi:hypothetical protein
MFRVRTAVMLLFCGAVLGAAGCGLIRTEPGETTQAAEAQVNCIGVLPAATARVPQGAAGEEKAKSLRQGAETMDRLLQQELQGRANVHFVGHDLLAGLELTGGESSAELARIVGERISCNAVLEAEVSRFDERDGGKYSVEAPAAVAFDFQLFAVASGAVLWSATFDETQTSVMENLYEWKKAKSRGFSWVTAEGLMLEGVRAKLENSPYFRN